MAMKDYSFWFVVGSQFLYGPEVLDTVAARAAEMADTLKKIGMTVDYRAMDWGSVLTRRVSKAAPAQGGWSGFVTFSAGADNATPAANTQLRAQGQRKRFGLGASVLSVMLNEPKISR